MSVKENNLLELQKLSYLHLSTDCFMKISLQSTGNLHEAVYRQMQIN